MAKLKQHTAVSSDFLDDPSATIITHDFDVPAAHLWQSLLDADAWTHWLPITKVVWTSPKPFGVGTTRTVDVGKNQIEETFFGWEDGTLMAFRFERSSLPLRAGAESYRVDPTPNGSRLIWTFRFDAFFIIKPLITQQMRQSGRKGLPKLEALIKSDPARFSA